MSLSTGKRHGSYEILSAIGAGGMGEVYRARDTSLKRDVALKILPESFATDSERLARFQREAEVLASLNHPNIAAIYGLDHANGVKALVMELVEGEDLAERIARGAIPVDEALPIATQIAEALEAAHDHGVIHRDLKPANVKVRPDGTVKVLDFGLAKALEPTAVMSGVSQSPTVTTPAMTQAGVILGTAAYMSPEQARGRVVDKRTDVWAFGCVLFEMLTGARAFGGDTVTDTLARVLEREPDWHMLPASLPTAVRTVLDRCLRKDPAKRIHDISDARIELENDAPANQPPAAHPGRRWSHTQMIAIAVGGLLIGGGITGAIVAKPPREAVAGRQALRIPIDSSSAPLIREQEVDGQAEQPFSVSQDGRYLVYIGRPAAEAPAQLIVRALDQQDATGLAGTTGARHPFFSPDGQWIAYWSPDGVWKRVLRTGGNPVELWHSSGVSRGGTWLADNSIVVANTATASGLLQIPFDGGEPKVLTRLAPGELNHWYPSALPGGRGVLFTTIRSDRSEVSVLDFSSGRTTTLIRDAGAGVYVEPGYLVYAIPGALRARRFDLQRLEALGESVSVLDGVRSGNAEAAFAASRNGLLVFAPGASGAAERRSIVWVDRSGREQSVGVPLHAYFHPRLSRDDARLAVVARDEDQDLWLWDFNQRALTRLTSGSARELNPVWLPDNEHLLYASRTKSGVVQVFSVRADGAGTATQVTSGSDSLWPISVTPDGLTAVVVSLAPNTQQQLALVHLAGNGRMESLLTGNSRIINGEVSPDGQWLAYQSNAMAREDIYLRPFPNVNVAMTRIAAGTQPAWCRAGRELFYLDADGYLTQVTVESGRPGTPHRVLDRRSSGSNLGRTYDISRDCQRFVMLKDEASIPTDTPLRMTLLVDWIEDLKRVLPPQ